MERTYWHLARQLQRTEFVWFVPNDDNRCEDGKDLRPDFLSDNEIEVVDPYWMDQPCSFLEMLIALSRRLSSLSDGEPRDWFWHLIDNLDLSHFNDAHLGEDESDEVQEIIDRVIFRNYDRRGRGGLFPLEDSTRDQRNVEIWYQLNAYLIERNL